MIPLFVGGYMENLENITDIGYDNCLRPEFTQHIIDKLISKRISVNLIGDPGTGKTRLLEDIHGCLPPDVKMVSVNLKSYTRSYSGLLREIHRQLDWDSLIPSRLDDLFSQQNGKTSQRIVFCLDNYDAILGNVEKDDAYNVDFFDELNSLKNGGKVVLMCTTKLPHSTLLVYIAGESNRNSWLTLEPVSLPSLSPKQISIELSRLLKPETANRLTTAPAHKEKLEKSIYDHPMPYARLCFFSDKLNLQSADENRKSFKKRMKDWEDEFKRFHSNSFTKRIHNVRTKTDGAIIASGLNKRKGLFQTIIELGKAWKSK